MIIQFYQSPDDPKKVNKTMNPIGSGEATLQATVNNTDDTVSLLSPGFILASNTSYYSATHVKAASMGNRYYFINNITLLTGGKMMIHCSIDVLATYADNIKLCKGTIVRSESVGAPTMIADSKLPVYTNKRITVCDNFKKTPFSVDYSNISPYILTTIGGEPSGS